MEISDVYLACNSEEVLKWLSQKNYTWGYKSGLAFFYRIDRVNIWEYRNTSNEIKSIKFSIFVDHTD